MNYIKVDDLNLTEGQNIIRTDILDTEKTTKMSWTNIATGQSFPSTNIYLNKDMSDFDSIIMSFRYRYAPQGVTYRNFYITKEFPTSDIKNFNSDNYFIFELNDEDNLLTTGLCFSIKSDKRTINFSQITSKISNVSLYLQKIYGIKYQGGNQ